MDEIPPQVPGYRLTRVLGRGSTSTVWRARRDVDDELVAIKLLPAGADEEAVREYAMLQHAAAEHVVTLHETLEVDSDDGPAIALVLEHLAGGSLARVVAERGHLTPGETVTVIAPIAQAVAGLHDLGIVHGDLSPGNVLLDSTGRPALSDLGYSRLTGEPAGDVYGTDGHVAPEVLDGGDPTRAADVHSLGALAWLCLTGAAPGHIAERASLADLVPGVPALVAVVESCLVPDAEARPEADEVARSVFDAVPAQPLRMTATGDVATSLTRRIREAAAEDEVRTPQWQLELTRAETDEPRRRWWRRQSRRRSGGTRAKGGRHAAPRRHRDEPIDLTRDVEPVEESEPRAIARSALGRDGGGRRVGALVTVGLGLLLAVLVPWQQLASAGAPDAQTPVAPQGTKGETSPLHDRSAAREAPRQLVQELTDLRQTMVVELDDSARTTLDEPGSPAATRDRELVAELRTSGARYRGLTMTVRSASLQSTSGDRAVVRAVVDESAYDVAGKDGSRTPRPARQGQEVDLVLVWHDGAWRVRDVTAAPDRTD
ncbi:protein kinase domain-containing protein [Janibacter anophelis]|uniref:protein kinase domain-containing protein n=1 Tax=Janibacter anophelis TaxID=319054 RepID=UPI00082F6493|nr:protein kinase [Janibacter anophelis]